MKSQKKQKNTKSSNRENLFGTRADYRAMYIYKKAMYMYQKAMYAYHHPKLINDPRVSCEAEVAILLCWYWETLLAPFSFCA